MSLNACFIEVDATGTYVAFHPVQIQRGQIIPEYNFMSIWSEPLPEDSSKVTEALLESIVKVFNRMPTTADFNDGRHERLVIWLNVELIPPNINLLQLSAGFIHSEITLVFVTEITRDFQTWDLYRETARNTGGEYILLPSDPTALERAILSVINGGDTLRQAFLHLRTQQSTATPSRPTDANEQTQGAANDLIFPFD
ncbi:unnamed protein product [Adineta ricciae]|uniref:Uncharacterized protein n=1 Tax=Adineta ricciae TaxID=249248 RepID=A0A816DSV4_ADIRI|nr:unnamed protein product [Adineta ricciae]CAF1638646.1 unnamed protein product [Adineta ricciae]